MNTKNAETPRSPWQEVGRRKRKKKEPSQQKKEACAHSAVTSGVKTPKSFLILVEGTMRPSLKDVLAILSTNSSRLFYQRPTTKTTNNGLVKITRHRITDLTATTENTGFRHISQKRLSHC